MNESSITRRNFFRISAAAAAAATLAKNKSTYAKIPSLVKIEEPFHGAILNRRLGEQSEKGLKIKVTGDAPLGDKITINSVGAKRSGRKFTAEIILKDQITEITADSVGSFGQNQHRIKVVWDKYSYPRYRFAIDDNSFFLRDIFQNNYKSLFDCFYLKMLKDLHDKYGALFTLNIYYTTGDDFNLTQFSDKYKGQWQDNCDWLKLALHAYANKPDRPYQFAPADKVIADLDLVSEQILRFAGEQTYTPPTVIHWASVIPAALKPLYERGVRVLSGGFKFRYGGWDGNYHLDEARSEYVSRSDGLMDFESGIIFSDADIVCNKVPVSEVAPKLEKIAKDPARSEFIDCFTHEQYFWPFYHHYIPDHAERLDATIRWLTERGYKPVFVHEGLLAKAK